jgi:tetratricopeptide (TPR) repeat protein
MKNKSWIFLFILSAIVFGVFLVNRPKPNINVPPREEIEAIPGAVAYPEGTSHSSELFEQAIAALKEDDIEGAIAVYQQVVEQEPNNAGGYIGLGSCYLMKEDLAAAEQAYQHARTLEPQSTMALLGLGSTAYRQAQYQSAKDFYEEALRIKSDLADAHWGLGLACDALNERAKAIEHFERFLQLAPDSIQAEAVRQRLVELLMEK